jgi:microcystin-dependent protein
MSDPLIGQIILFAGNFAPRGWAFCDGQLLPIAQNQALFSILGTMYGGDGRTTFALPDLRGRSPIGVGLGPGLQDRRQGEKGGQEQVALTTAQLPSHTHALTASTKAATSRFPREDRTLGKGSSKVYTKGGTPKTLDPSSVASAGGSQPHDNMPPYLAIRYIIALQGIFPSRS